MIDLTLGLGKEIKIERFTAHYSRFGIISSKPFIDSNGGVLSFTNIKPFSKAKVKFKEYEFSPYVYFEANLYSSPLNEIYSREVFKV